MSGPLTLPKVKPASNGFLVYTRLRCTNPAIGTDDVYVVLHHLSPVVDESLIDVVFIEPRQRDRS